MRWDPWEDIVEKPLKKVEEFVSDSFKGIEKAGSDFFKSDAGRIITAATIGYFTGGYIGGTAAAATTGTAVGAGYGIMSVQQKKAFESAEALQRTQIAAQKELQRRQIELAGQQYTLTEEQMELQMGQRQIGMLADLYLAEDRREPRILTLPASREPPGIIDRINLWMDQALRA